jgi:PEP-CTERM/exosortase A-associated glycosyltransferase
MRILHVLMGSLPDITGYSIRSQEIMSSEKKLGLDVYAITSPYQKNVNVSNKHEVIQSIPFYRTNLWDTSGTDGKRSADHFIKKYFLFNHFKKKVYELCLELKPDVIHGHSYFFSGYPAAWAAKKMGIPFIYELRGLIQDSGVSRSKFKVNSLQYRYIDYMEGRTFRAASKVVTISRALQEYLFKKGISSDKVGLVPNGVDTSRFTPIEKDKELMRRYRLEGKIVMGFIGSFFSYEGLDYLINQFKMILKHEQNVVLFLVGAGEKYEELKRLTKELQLEDSVILTGRVDHTEILKYYSVVDIFIYPRVKEWMTETVTPLKPLEAMAMGKAVIGRDIGGLRELIDDEKTGLLFKDDDTEDFISKCLLLIRNQRLRETLGSTARDKMVLERDWMKLAERYVSLYKSIVEKGKRNN